MNDLLYAGLFGLLCIGLALSTDRFLVRRDRLTPVPSKQTQRRPWWV